MMKFKMGLRSKMGSISSKIRRKFAKSSNHIPTSEDGENQFETDKEKKEKIAYGLNHVPTLEDIRLSDQTIEDGENRFETDKGKEEKITQSLPHTAEAIISWEIQKLEIWLWDNIWIFENIRRPNVEAMTEIFDELRMMADFLRDKKSGEGSKLNCLVGEVVQMVEDIMDLTEFTIMYNVIDKIELVRDWVRETRMRMINSGADGDEPLVVAMENVGDEEVVGLEEDVRVLLRIALFNEKESLSTLLVKGMPGIGKTALARKVYNHKAVIGRFKRRAWVSLSSDLTNKEVLIKIIQQVVGSEELRRDSSLLEKMEHADNQSLQQMLRQHLRGMPYLIVVDNVLRGMRYMRSLMNCLPDEEKGSRLLLTSRSQDYIEIAYVHEMKALDPDKSWQLFLKTINKFTSDEEKYNFPKHLEKKGKEMVAKCGGLPVAIIDVGRQKAKQRLEKGIEWEELLEIDSIDLSVSLDLLESSYRELDDDLRARFMYVAFFKENSTIVVKKLEQIWASASGFAERTDRSFISDLSRESFVEAVDRAPFAIKNCRVNPLLHMLSIKIAEEEIGFEILRNSDGNSNGANSHTRDRVIHCGRDKFNRDSTINQDKHLVSLIFHGGGAYFDDAYWRRFELLNLLDLEDFGLKILSETIGSSLMELKYLGLRNNYIQEIPRSLGCLKKLEVLDISENFMVEVPDIIWETSGLHHLHMSDVICPKPLKIDKMEHLKTLAYIPAYEALGLGRTMKKLERLGVEEVDENTDVSNLFATLAKLKKFYHLTLRGFRFRSMPCLDEVCYVEQLHTLKLDGLLTRLPNAANLGHIVELTLVNSRLDEDPMPILGKIPYLKYLKLRNAYTGRQMVIRRDRFPYLEVLRIKELWNLRNLKVIPGSFAGMYYLKTLEIDNCPYLETLPREIWGLKGLMEFKMVTTKDIATKIRNSGEIPKSMDVDISP